MTKTVTVSGYDPLAHQGPVDIMLHITGLPPDRGNLDAQDEWYKEQADIIANVLFNSLPQGTAHRLLIKMMDQYASCYRGKIGT